MPRLSKLSRSITGKIALVTGAASGMGRAAAHQRLIRAALLYLTTSGAGRIVNIASTEAVGGSAFASPYTAAKHGVMGLTD